jgi:hypothetical protein
MAILTKTEDVQRSVEILIVLDEFECKFANKLLSRKRDLRDWITWKRASFWSAVTFHRFYPRRPDAASL